jgi:type VI protein secretion system component VasK
MPLTLNQFLLLVITIAVVVAVTFLVTFLRQLRKTAHEAEKTLIEITQLVGEARETSRSVQAKIEDIGELVRASKKTAMSISEIAWFVSMKILRPSSKYWPFLFPLIRLGWRQAKKLKEEKNVR